MKKLFSRFDGVVWTAVLSVTCSVGAVIIALAGASTEVVTAVAIAGATLAILAPTQ